MVHRRFARLYDRFYLVAFTVSPTKNNKIIVEHQVHIEERSCRRLLALSLRLSPYAVSGAECPHIVKDLVSVFSTV